MITWSQPTASQNNIYVKAHAYEHNYHKPNEQRQNNKNKKLYRINKVELHNLHMNKSCCTTQATPRGRKTGTYSGGKAEESNKQQNKPLNKSNRGRNRILDRCPSHSGSEGPSHWMYSLLPTLADMGAGVNVTTPPHHPRTKALKKTFVCIRGSYSTGIACYSNLILTYWHTICY